MRIASGITDQYIYFVGVDATDFATRETGLSSFTVYRSRNGGAAAAMTTPTINETDSSNMPGVYELLLDEDMTIDSGDDTQEMVFHITHAGMAPVTRTIELYRPKITAGNTLDVTSTGAAGIDWGNVENPSTSVDLSATSINLCDTVTTNTDMRGTDSAATATALATAQTDLDTITGSDGVTLATTQGNYAPAKAGDNMGTVSAVTGGINTGAGTITTLDGLDTAQDTQHAQTQSDIGDLNNLSTAQVNAEVDTALSDIHLDHLFATDYDPASKPGTATALLNELVESDVGVSRFTANALEEAPTGGSAPTVGEIADAVLDEALSGHVTAGTLGKAIADIETDVTAILTDTDTTIPGLLATIDNNVDAILVDTGTDIPARFDGIEGATFDTATDSLEAIRNRGDAAWTTGAGGSSPTVEQIRQEMDANSTQLAAIVEDTGTTLPATLATIAGYIDTEVAAILEDTGTTIPGLIATAQADLDIVTGADGVTLATLQANYAPNTATPLDAAGVRTAVGLASANLDTQIAALPTAAETRAEIDSNSTQLAAIVADTNELQTDDIPGLIAALNDPSVAEILTTQMTEAYSADGTAPTLAQALFLILSFLQERAVSGTTVTTKKLDGSTTAATYTLDDATTPTSITRSG